MDVEDLRRSQRRSRVVPRLGREPPTPPQPLSGSQDSDEEEEVRTRCPHLAFKTLGYYKRQEIQYVKLLAGVQFFATKH